MADKKEWYVAMLHRDGAEGASRRSPLFRDDDGPNADGFTCIVEWVDISCQDPDCPDCQRARTGDAFTTDELVQILRDAPEGEYIIRRKKPATVPTERPELALAWTEDGDLVANRPLFC